ncbi:MULTISPECIES: ice-binding family protein [unclassified Curtobacterium]|uniref:ice-binding family protein n=1 Tax=unclassified Curtobacterium TaxID=257496 RepID=UPI0037F2C085
MASTHPIRPVAVITTGIGLAAVLALGSASSASAATVLDGPVGLGIAATYGVLGASAVTNTGATLVTGDLGVAPGTSVTGFGGAPNGVVTGTTHPTDPTDTAAVQAQLDATTAYTVAASLTPTRTGIRELNGLSLIPGVYTGGELALANNGALTLAGDADSVWVFQAASTLTIGSGTRISITGGANACNVFWQVGSSATIGTGAQFQGTVLADQSISVTNGATVAGRLLARNGAVTLDTDRITAPTGCPTPGTPQPSVAPTITSGTPATATAGTPYSATVTANGLPKPTFSDDGTLPDGLAIDTTTGVISGTPTTAGTTSVTITAGNGTGPDATQTFDFTVAPAAVVPTPTPTPTPAVVSPVGTPAPSDSATAGAAGSGPGASELAFTGADPVPGLVAAGSMLAVGAFLLVLRYRRRAGRARHLAGLGTTAD